MTHIVIDCESLSLTPTAHILSFGAIAISDTGEYLGNFYRVLVGEQPGRDVDPNTVAWWMTVPEQAARDAIWQLSGHQQPIIRALIEFAGWYAQHDNGPQMAVWGNGPEVDCVWLETLCKDFHVDLPWKFYEQNSIRTLKLLHPECAEVGPFEGVKHHALDDAKHEAKMLQKHLQEPRIDTTCLSDVAPSHAAKSERWCSNCNGVGFDSTFAICIACNGTGLTA